MNSQERYSSNKPEIYVHVCGMELVIRSNARQPVFSYSM